MILKTYVFTVILFNLMSMLNKTLNFFPTKTTDLTDLKLLNSIAQWSFGLQKLLDNIGFRCKRSHGDEIFSKRFRNERFGNVSLCQLEGLKTVKNDSKCEWMCVCVWARMRGHNRVSSIFYEFHQVREQPKALTSTHSNPTCISPSSTRKQTHTHARTHARTTTHTHLNIV